MNHLNDYLELSRKRRLEEFENLNSKLGSPDLEYIIKYECFEQTFGLWRVPGGIIQYQKTKRGWNPDTRREWTVEELERLNKVMARPERSLDN